MAHNNLIPLLDFDSTRGVIEDKTGKNVLTNSNVVVKKTGRVYSAYFKGTSTSITTNYNLGFSSPLVINSWAKRVGNYIDVNIIDTQNKVTTNAGITIRLFNNTVSSGDQLIVYYNSGANNNISYHPNTSFLRGFNNFVFFFTINTLFIFINGIQVTTMAIPLSSGYSNSNNLVVGDSLGTVAATNSYISKIQIYKGLPNNINQFAAQTYNSQKWQFL